MIAIHNLIKATCHLKYRHKITIFGLHWKCNLTLWYRGKVKTRLRQWFGYTGIWTPSDLRNCSPSKMISHGHCLQHYHIVSTWRKIFLYVFWNIIKRKLSWNLLFFILHVGKMQVYLCRQFANVTSDKVPSLPGSNLIPSVPKSNSRQYNYPGLMVILKILQIQDILEMTVGQLHISACELFKLGTNCKNWRPPPARIRTGALCLPSSYRHQFSPQPEGHFFFDWSVIFNKQGDWLICYLHTVWF